VIDIFIIMNHPDEEEVRPPDAIVSERLLPHISEDRTEYVNRTEHVNRTEEEMKDALYLSIQEFNQQNEIQSNYEEQIIKEFIAEREKRLEVFKDFLFQMHRIAKYDTEVREVYSMIDPILDSYCNQYIQTCELDIETHTKIFNIVKKIRNQQSMIPLLEKIIIPT